MINSKYIAIVAVLVQLLFSFISHGQTQFHYGGNEWFTTVNLSNSGSPQGYFIRRIPWVVSDSSFCVYRFGMTSGLTMDSITQISVPSQAPFVSNGVIPIEGAPKHFLLLSRNPNGQSPINHHAWHSQFYYSHAHNDSLKTKKTLLPDSAYTEYPLTPTAYFLPNNDTLFINTWFSEGSTDSIEKNWIIKVDTISSVITRKILKLSDQGYEYTLIGKPKVLPSGDLYFNVTRFNGQIGHGGGAIINKSLSRVIKYFYTLGGAYDYWLLKDNRLVGTSQNLHYDPTIPIWNFKIETLLEVIDLDKDSVSTKYFFPRSPVSAVPVGVSKSPGCYFNGEHFILSETVKQDTFPGTNYKTDIFVVDTNFQVLNRMSITDSTPYYEGAITHIIPHPNPDSSLTYFYFGNGYSPLWSNTMDLMWGRFKVNTHVNLDEYQLRKAEVSLYPNPAGNYVELLIDSENAKDYKVEIYNIEGKKCLETTCSEKRNRIDFDLPAGTYAVLASSGANREYLQLIVK